MADERSIERQAAFNDAADTGDVSGCDPTPWHIAPSVNGEATKNRPPTPLEIAQTEYQRALEHYDTLIEQCKTALRISFKQQTAGELQYDDKLKMAFGIRRRAEGDISANESALKTELSTKMRRRYTADLEKAKSDYHGVKDTPAELLKKLQARTRARADMRFREIFEIANVLDNGTLVVAHVPEDFEEWDAEAAQAIAAATQRIEDSAMAVAAEKRKTSRKKRPKQKKVVVS